MRVSFECVSCAIELFSFVQKTIFETTACIRTCAISHVFAFSGQMFGMKSFAREKLKVIAQRNLEQSHSAESNARTANSKANNEHKTNQMHKAASMSHKETNLEQQSKQTTTAM